MWTIESQSNFYNKLGAKRAEFSDTFLFKMMTAMGQTNMELTRMKWEHPDFLIWGYYIESP